MKRVALYVRVSTEEQKLHGFSVDAQISALQEFCQANNYNVVGLYNDAGISASKTYKKRPALVKLIADCNEDKIDVILFTKLDRWFRSVSDYYEVQRELDKNNVSWKCIWEDYETETSAGRFKVNIMLSVAQSESERTSERIRQTNEYKRSMGQICSGGVAKGYIIKDKHWVKDPSLSTGVELFFKTYLSTLSIKKSLAACDDIGYHFTSHNATRFLRNSCYYAEPLYVPQEEAYITLDEHSTIEKSLRSLTRRRKYPSTFNGLLKCAHCGHALTPLMSKRYQCHSKVMYICTLHNSDSSKCSGSTINDEYLEQYLLDNIDGLLKDYKLSLESEVKQIETRTKLQNDKARLKRLRDLYELGDITIDEYKEKRALLNDEIEMLSQQSSASDNIPVMPDNWKDIYNTLDLDHKRTFWYNIIDRVIVEGRQCQNPKIIFTH